MRAINRKICVRLVLAAVVTLMAASCSTTKKLGENDVLYTGVKRLKYHEDSVKVDEGVKTDIFTAINVRPNNPLYSPYLRTPFPIGLMIYNNIDEDATGFKGWLFKHFAAKPVLISRVNPKARVDMINTILRNNGYFTSSASYELLPDKSNPKKAKVSYDVNINPPYTIGNVEYTGGKDPLMMMIDSLARENRYFRTGSRYCLDSLSAVRIDITNFVRDRGYYFFRPEYIQYLADSVQDKGIIHMHLIPSGDIPNNARIRYRTNNITASVVNDDAVGEPDTVETRYCTLIRYEPVYIKDRVIPSCIRARKGRLFRVNSIDRTQAALSRLGIFSTVDIQVIPLDTITPEGEGLLDLAIYCQLDKPWEVTFEMHGTSKSNSFIGPGVEVGARHKNAFGAGEKFSVDIYGDYEWQTGGGKYKGGDFDSYEFGIEGKLDFPRLLAPKFLYPSRRYTNWTRFLLSADLLNRPGFFKMAQFNMAATWEWHGSRYSSHLLTPFKLTYNKVISRSEQFDSAMIHNPALAQSFIDVFVPKIEYTYTFDRDITPVDHITLTAGVAEAGNIVSGVWSIFKSKGTKELFGTPFSQFVKAQAQVVWTRKLGIEGVLATRVFMGAVHAYGNSSEVPYREQFYVGGSNSVRAFAVRTIGPGGYHPAYRDRYTYYDQTGTFKFEANAEYRFPILGYFKGAVFLDAGNIWLLKDDERRPEGKLKMKNFFDQLALGTGLGLRFDMSMLVVRADLGIGIHAPYKTDKRGYYNIPKFKDGLAFHLAIGYPF